MKSNPSAYLTLCALWELTRYDLSRLIFGAKGVYEGRSVRIEGPGSPPSESEELICQAMRLATSLYWKRVRCLQLSVATARLLWRHRANAEVVIGYRPIPLLVHAWVEVDGRVINESAAYRTRLQILDRISPKL